MKATDEDGIPKPISRILGVDRAGTLYIGKADNFTSRVFFLHKCVRPHSKSSGHPVAIKLAHHAGLREAYPAERLTVDLIGDVDPGRAESALLADYFRAYGETPPFNRLG